MAERNFVEEEHLTAAFPGKAALAKAREEAEKVLQQEGLDSYGFLSVSDIDLSGADGSGRGEDVSWIQTLLVVVFPYYAGTYAPDANLSLYCRGRDYHKVVPAYLNPAGEAVKGALPEGCRYEAFADTGPFRDRLIAFKAGLGVRGMNQMLIHPRYGSYCFIGSLAFSVPLPADPARSVPKEPGCLRCGRCLRACPGGSLREDGSFRLETCRSFITQKKGDLTPEEIRIFQEDSLIFGCDICQTVCPMNQNVTPSPIPEFTQERIDRLDLSDLEGLTNKTFLEKYPDRAFTWRGPQVLRRNLLLQQEAPREIERKYLVKELPEHIGQYPHTKITQGYVSRHPVTRFRKEESASGTRYIRTVKGGGLSVRTEVESELTPDAYEAMKANVEGKILEKTRYRIPLSGQGRDGLTAELDIFQGSLAPLKLVEVEFPSVEAMNAFTPPDWFGEDVTLSGQYQNSRLSAPDTEE